MDSRQAKEILMRYRPGTTDDGDPEFTEALEQAKRDRELGRWFEQHRAFQSTVADRFKGIAVPQHLREKILAEYNPARIIVAWFTSSYRRARTKVLPPSETGWSETRSGATPWT